MKAINWFLGLSTPWKLFAAGVTLVMLATALEYGIRDAFALGGALMLIAALLTGVNEVTK